MRKVPKPLLAPAAQTQPAAGASRRRAIGTAVRKGAGHSYLAALVTLLYITIYQYLPETLNGHAVKPFSTAGTIDRIIKVVAILLSIVVIASRWAVMRRFLKTINPGLLACMILIPLSAIWSIDTNATLLRFVTMLGIFLLCVAICLAGWEHQRYQKVLLPPVLGILIVSLLFGIVAPDAVKEIGDDISLKDAWRGITFQKNQFGMTASIGVILCVHRWLAPGKHSVWNLAWFVISFSCLLLSRSSTSLLGTLLALFFMILVMKVPVIKQSFTTLVVVGIFTTIIVYELAIQNLIPGVYTLVQPIMEMTGKDMTFSSRSVIWEIVKEHSRLAPWLGSGYGAYWTGDTPGSPSYVFVWRMSFYPMSSHNGYLEILNDLGRVGLICLLAFLVWFVRQALELMQFDRAQAVLYLALLYQQMVANLSESEWFSRSSVSTTLVLGAVCLSRSLYEHRMRGTPAAPVNRHR